MSARLLLDAGNSRLKWALARDRGWEAQGELSYGELAQLADVSGRADCCVVASVTSGVNEGALRTLLRDAGVSTSWLSADAPYDGVTNGYADPAQLGVDRWMAAIAGYTCAGGPLLIVSVGTAMTVDAVSADGVFMGGLIIPGPRLMQQAIEHGTARVEVETGLWADFPTTSADAVHSGIVAALAGAVLLQHGRLEAAAGTAPRCFLTGGGAALLRPHLPVAADWVPNLVLEGIDLISRTHCST